MLGVVSWHSDVVDSVISWYTSWSNLFLCSNPECTTDSHCPHRLNRDQRELLSLAAQVETKCFLPSLC